MADLFSEDQILSSLTKVAKDINKLNDLEVATPGDRPVKADVATWVKTDSLMLNLLMGDSNLGMACGRIYELFGDFSEGKSTIAQIMMNAFQQAGGISVLLDTEASWNRSRAEAMGHNGKKHLAVEVETCEMGFKVIQDCTAQFKSSFGAKLPIIFVWDTLAATPTQDEKSGDEYASGMTYKPRLIRAELRKITPELKKINASIVFVNQTIENVKGHNKGGVKTTPGGGGVKFWASQRLQVEKVGVFQDAEDKKKELGIISQVKVVKNKFAAPNKKADLPLRYDVGIDPIREVCNYLNDNTNVYNTAGAYKKIVGFTDDDISFYERDIDKVLAKHPGLFDYLKENAINHWLTGKTLIE